MLATWGGSFWRFHINTRSASPWSRPLVSPQNPQSTAALSCLVLPCLALSFIVLFSHLRGQEQPSLSQARRRRTKLSHVVPVNWLAELCWAGLGESHGLAARRFTAVSCYQKVRLDCVLTRQLKMHAFTWIIDLLAGCVASGQLCYNFFTTTAKKWRKNMPKDCSQVKQFCLFVVVFFVCSCSLNEPPSTTWREGSMFVRCFCCQEKSTAFDFWMPIERRHQLPAFSSHLKGEMFYTGLVLLECADRHDISVCPFLTVASRVPAELL